MTVILRAFRAENPGFSRFRASGFSARHVENDSSMVERYLWDMTHETRPLSKRLVCKGSTRWLCFEGLGFLKYSAALTENRLARRACSAGRSRTGFLLPPRWQWCDTLCDRQGYSRSDCSLCDRDWNSQPRSDGPGRKLRFRTDPGDLCGFQRPGQSQPANCENRPPPVPGKSRPVAGHAGERPRSAWEGSSRPWIQAGH